MKRSVKTNEMIVADGDFNIADYPACKLFMPITETSGLVLADLAGNQDITFAPLIDETFTFAGDGVTIAGTVAMSSDKAEILPDLGITNDLIHVVVSDFNADNVSITVGSDTNEAAIKLVRKSGAGASFLRDTTPTTNTFLSTAIDANTQATAMYTVRATPRLFLVETDGAEVTSPQNIALTAIAGLDLNGGNNAIQLGKDIKLYGMATFTFTPATMPPQNEILAAISWMNYQWRNGNKVLYPPWKNKT